MMQKDPDLLTRNSASSPRRSRKFQRTSGDKSASGEIEKLALHLKDADSAPDEVDNDLQKF